MVSLVVVFVFFILTALFISYRDIRISMIEDRYMIPLTVLLASLLYWQNELSIESFIAAAIVVFLFMIPIFFNMDFGGGDLRYGAFCALFVGLGGIGWFVMFSGLLQLLLSLILQKRSLPFAPAMSAAALGTYGVAHL